MKTIFLKLVYVPVFRAIRELLIYIHLQKSHGNEFIPEI